MALWEGRTRAPAALARDMSGMGMRRMSVTVSAAAGPAECRVWDYIIEVHETHATLLGPLG